MADVVTTADSETLGLLQLAQLIIEGGSAEDWASALADLESDFGFGIPVGVTYDSMVAAGPPPQTVTWGSDAAAFTAWVASLS